MKILIVTLLQSYNVTFGCVVEGKRKLNTLLYDKADASSIKMNVVRQIIKDLGLDLQALQSEGKLKAADIKEENGNK